MRDMIPMMLVAAGLFLILHSIHYPDLQVKEDRKLRFDNHDFHVVPFQDTFRLEHDPACAACSRKGDSVTCPHVPSCKPGRCPVRDRRPCRDYDEDCDDMDMEEIRSCEASTNPEDDQEGFCVMKQRQN